MNIYVGNLSKETSEQGLKEAFEAFGQVSSVAVLKDRYTGEPRGFGFVEMPEKSEGIAAISGLNGKELNGRAIKVNEAKPREDRNGGGRGGSRGGGSRGGGGGGGGRRTW
ncbi:MAG: RNA-binding protein [bacterium]